MFVPQPDMGGGGAEQQGDIEIFVGPSTDTITRLEHAGYIYLMNQIAILSRNHCNQM